MSRMIYSDPNRASDEWSLPDVEVFYCGADAAPETFGFIWDEGEDAWLDEDGDVVDPASKVGWYWWTCLPDSPPLGPFATEDDAITDAQSIS